MKVYLLDMSGGGRNSRAGRSAEDGSWSTHSGRGGVEFELWVRRVKEEAVGQSRPSSALSRCWRRHGDLFSVAFGL